MGLPFWDTSEYTLQHLPRCITTCAPVIPGPLDPRAGQSARLGKHLELFRAADNEAAGRTDGYKHALRYGTGQREADCACVSLAIV